MPKPVTAQVASVQGAVEIVHSGARSPIAAGAEVIPGDVVEAGPGSAVELGFHGVHVQLGPSSSMYVVQAVRTVPAWQLQIAVNGSCEMTVRNDTRLVVYAGHTAITAKAVAVFRAITGADSQNLTLEVASGAVSIAGPGGRAMVHAGQAASVAAPTSGQPRPVPIVVSRS